MVYAHIPDAPLVEVDLEKSVRKYFFPRINFETDSWRKRDCLWYRILMYAFAVKVLWFEFGMRLLIWIAKLAGQCPEDEGLYDVFAAY